MLTRMPRMGTKRDVSSSLWILIAKPTNGDRKMANRVTDISLPQAARLAEFGNLVIALLAPLAIFANFFVLENLIVPGMWQAQLRSSLLPGGCSGPVFPAWTSWLFLMGSWPWRSRGFSIR